MTNRKLFRRGFSLVEIMIVVAILSILAAIVIPTFSNASETASASTLSSQIGTINKALVLYKAEHNETYPTAAQLITNQWQALLNSTDPSGDITGSDLGPYFLESPFNSFIGSDVVAADNSAAWQYDASSGSIYGVVPSDVYSRADDLQLNQLDLVVEP